MVESKKMVSSNKGLKRGRKEKFREELCREIVDKFFQQPFVHGQSSYEDIAEFGRKILKNDELQARHFTRKKNIKDRIDKINESIFRDAPQGDIAYIEFNPDNLMNIYGNDKETFMVILRRHADDYRSLNEKYLALQGAEVEYKIRINELEKKYDKLNQRYKEQKELAEKKTFEAKRLIKFKQLDDEFKMRAYLNSKVTERVLNVENIQMIINAIGFTGNSTYGNIDEKHLELKEYNNLAEDEKIDEEIIEDNDDEEYGEKKIISNNDKNTEEDDGVEEIIVELDNMIPSSS